MYGNRQEKPDIVLSWMSGKRRNRKGGRARTRTVQVGRLGGYYDLKYYRSCDHLIGNTPDIARYLGEEGRPETAIMPNFVAADPGTLFPELGSISRGRAVAAGGRTAAPEQSFRHSDEGDEGGRWVHSALAGDGPKARPGLSGARTGWTVSSCPGWRDDIADLMAPPTCWSPVTD